MKRFFSFAFALILLLGTFAGCSPKTQNPNPTGTQPVNPNGLSLEDSNGVVYESLAQKAVVKTALAYLARGTRIQYADTRLNVKDAPTTAGTLYRWQSGVRQSPEEYTSQYIGYTNCAAFTHDVYFAALDLKIGANSTAALSAIEDDRHIYHYFPTGNETEEEKATVEQEFRSNLKLGDIIVIRYNGNLKGNGHAMLYVGSKVLEDVEGYKGVAAEGTDDTGTPADAGYVYDIIHSTGSNYNYDKGVERYEKYGTVQKMSVDSLFDGKTGRHVFSKIESLMIIRPLATFKKEVPEDTKNRMLYMENIIAEKLSSHTAGMTVNPGDTMTFTFSITNKNKTDVTLPVKDVLPENVTYVSSENCTVDGTALSWTLTVPAGKTETVSYTVRVNEEVKAGTVVESKDGAVGGIPVNCPKVYIGRTLKDSEQQALLTAVKNHTNSNMRGLELANALYNEVLEKKDILPKEFSAMMEDLFIKPGQFSYLNWEGAYRGAVVPGLFGGRYVPQRDPSAKINEQIMRHEQNRTRLPYPDQLMVGDILIAEADAEGKTQKLYLYTGEEMLNLLSTTKLAFADSKEQLNEILAYNRFAILRPSLLLDSAT